MTGPVSDDENREVGGQALCAEAIWRELVEAVEDLRGQQAEYLASLPTDPQEAIRAARRIMYVNADSYPDGITEALHLSKAMVAMMKCGDLNEGEYNHNAALYVAEQIEFAMNRATRVLDRAGDILSNPARVQRERRAAAAPP